MREMTACSPCRGERDQCPRCGYLACSCEPYACRTGRASETARQARAAFDANGGRSEGEQAWLQFQALVRRARGARPA